MNKKIKITKERIKKAVESYNRIEKTLVESKTPQGFFSRMKNNKDRKFLREFLQDIYRVIAKTYNLPSIPVYLPARYRITKRGLTIYTSTGQVKSITIYFILSTKHIENLRSKKEKNYLYLNPFNDLFYTLAHEIAHVYEIAKNKNNNHNYAFYQTEEKILNEIKQIVKLD